jgi:hypothetical protein
VSVGVSTLSVLGSRGARENHGRIRFAIGARQSVIIVCHPLTVPEAPAPDPRYVRRWHRLRWGLIAHFGASVIWIPAGALLVYSSHLVTYGLVAVLTLASLGGGAVLWTFRCPRCNKRFFDESIAGQFDWIFRKRCDSCSLRRGALVDPARFGRQNR